MNTLGSLLAGLVGVMVIRATLARSLAWRVAKVYIGH
jgi:hypothetical protein